jgi:hypothetical protein
MLATSLLPETEDQRHILCPAGPNGCLLRSQAAMIVRAFSLRSISRALRSASQSRREKGAQIPVGPPGGAQSEDSLIFPWQ